MIGYAQQRMPAKALAIYEDAVKIVAQIEAPKDHPNAELVRQGLFPTCHDVTLIVWAVLEHRHQDVELHLRDGRCNNMEHSWISFHTPSVTGGDFILDVYAIARMPMVQLIDAAWAAVYDTYRANVEVHADGPYTLYEATRIKKTL